MVSAKGLEPGQESRVKLGLLLWPNVQLSLSFTTSLSCWFLPPRKPDPAHQGPILGPGMLCQHFPGPGKRRGGANAGSADLAPRQNILSHTHPLPYWQPHRQLSPWEGKVGRTLRWAAPPPHPLPVPCPGPRKAGYSGRDTCCSNSHPCPPAGDQRGQGDRARVAEQNAEGLKPKNKDRDRDRETEMERQQHRDNPERWIGRDTTQRPLAAIFGPPTHKGGGKKEDPEP